MNQNDTLMHYGVKGMKWGVRRESIPGVSSKTNREARKDAKEYTAAKMFFGEGAGTRRKLINATVNAKSAKDPSYKKAFDIHVGNTDMSKRASQARGQRKRKDVRNTTAKTARGVKNLAMGTGAPVAMSAVAVYAAAKNPAVRSVVTKAGKKAYSTVTQEANFIAIKKQFKNMNW